SRRRLAAPTAILTLAALWVAPNDYARYLPVFMLGVFMAFHRDWLWEARARIGDRDIAASAATLVTLLALSVRWWFPHANELGTTAYQATPLVIALGACGAVALPLVFNGAERVLTVRPLHWAGSRSFSLYLVHEPLIVALAVIVGGAP